jgi:hypothetical protein
LRRKKAKKYPEEDKKKKALFSLTAGDPYRYASLCQYTMEIGKKQCRPNRRGNEQAVFTKHPDMSNYKVWLFPLLR